MTVKAKVEPQIIRQSLKKQKISEVKPTRKRQNMVIWTITNFSYSSIILIIPCPLVLNDRSNIYLLDVNNARGTKRAAKMKR